jgi:hypothetical protein
MCQGSVDNEKLVIFLDNFDTVRRDVSGRHPPLDLVRQLLDCGRL